MTPRTTRLALKKGATSKPTIEPGDAQRIFRSGRLTAGLNFYRGTSDRTMMRGSVISAIA